MSSPLNGNETGPDRRSAPRSALGVVIPTLNEEESLPALLSDLSRLEWPHRVAVVDGGSTDATREIARQAGARVLDSSPGRGRQMNAGAEALATPWLLFLHADSRFPAEARTALQSWLPTALDTQAAYFRFQLEGRHWFWRFIEFGQRIREGLSGLVYGDQGLVVSRALFTTAGGFPHLPILEDVELIRALRRHGALVRIPAPIITSPRRYTEDGRWRGWLRNTAVMALYLAGEHPEDLARFYPPRQAGTTGRREPAIQRPDRSGSSGLLVFAKAPRPGRVKTRLAAEVGDREAARIYSILGRRVVDEAKGVTSTTTVYFDPPEARHEMEAWLGADGLEYRPQSPGDLGARMEAAFSEAFLRHSRVVAIGTDTPVLASRDVGEALRKLDSADLVLGPAEDGGYYLIALRAPAPGLFHDIPWSTSSVLRRTLDSAREQGLSVSLLPTLADVDTLADWTRVAPMLPPR